MPDEQQKKILPPYLAFLSFKNFIAALRETGLPGRIDKSIMGSMSGATQSSLMLTLRFFKLIEEDGTPTPALVNLAEGPEQNAPRTYAGLISSCYGFVAEKNANLETATQRQLEEAFESQGLSGDTLRKAVSFFVLLATDAGLKISAHLKSAKRRSNGGARKPRKRDGNEQPGGLGGTTPPIVIEAPGHKTYTLDLTVDGTRMIKVTAPTDLKSEEIERLSGWLHFQYNVAWKKSPSA